MPDELNWVGKNVTLELLKTGGVLFIEEIVEWLRQHHSEHVLDVEKVAIEQAELVEKLENSLGTWAFVRDVFLMTNRFSKYSKIFLCSALLTVL